MTAKVLLWMVGALALGLALVWWGLRGKRLNDHPVCRQCRFDLSGSPDGTVTCPECGAGLKRDGSVRIGQRQRRPVAIALGAAMIGLPTLAIGTAAFAMLTGTDLNAYKPLGLMLWEAKRTDSVRGKAIASELLKRYTAKKLEDPQVSSIVAAALELQANPKLPWCSEWGDLVEQAYSDKKASDAEVRTFRNQAAILDWKVRPRVRQGDPIPIVITLKEARIGAASALQSMVSFGSATIDGKPAPRAGLGFMSMNPQLGWFQMFGSANRMGMNGPYGEGKFILNCPKDIEPGRHTIKVSIMLRTKPQATRVTWNTPSKGDPETRTDEYELAFEVMEAAAPGIELVQPSAEQREKMELTLSPSQAQIYKYDSSQPPQASMTFSLEGRPLDGAFDVFWKSKDRTWGVGSFTTGTSADPRSNSMSFGGREEQRYVNEMVRGLGLDIDKVDVVLRPSTPAALQTLDIEKIYGAEIVFKDVMVDVRDMSAMRPRPAASSTKQQSTIEDAPESKEGNSKSAQSKGPSLFKSIHRLMGGGS